MTQLIIAIILITSCSNNVDVTNGSDHFIYNRYICRDTSELENIYLPFITKETIDTINIIDVETNLEIVPEISITGLRFEGEYKKLNSYILRLTISNITDSIIIDNLSFIINSNKVINYSPISFMIIKSEYKLIDHDSFKLSTSILHRNNVPSIIWYYIDSTDFYITEVKSMYTIIEQKIEPKQTLIGVKDSISISIEPIQIMYPLYVYFNFQYIISNGEEEYIYLDSIVINRLNNFSNFGFVIDSYYP